MIAHAISHPTTSEWVLGAIIVLVLFWGIRRGKPRNTSAQDMYNATHRVQPQATPVSASSGTASVVLLNPGKDKIQVIKEVRDAIDCGLKDAKDLIDAAEVAPQTIVTNIDESAADLLVQTLRSHGALAEVR